MSKFELIAGITGQDVAYFTDFLFERRYVVHRTKWRSSSLNTQKLSTFTMILIDIPYKYHAFSSIIVALKGDRKYFAHSYYGGC